MFCDTENPADDTHIAKIHVLSKLIQHFCKIDNAESNHNFNHSREITVSRGKYRKPKRETFI